MKNVTLFLILMLCACCSDEDDTKKHLYYIFIDSSIGIGAIGSTSIEPESNQITAIHTHADDPVDLVADLSSGNLYMSSGNLGVIEVYRKGNLSDVDELYSLQSQSVTALAVDHGRNRIYWADNIHSTINMGSLDGKLTPVALFSGAAVTSHCTGIAVNTQTNILYFTDDASDKILAADLNAGTVPTELVNSDNFDIIKPRDLVLSKDGNFLYWPDSDNHIITTDVNTGESTALLNTAGQSLFLYAPSNDLYIAFNQRIYRTNLDKPEGYLTKVFEDEAILGFVIK